MVGVIAIKFVLMVFCFRQGTSSGKTLAIDHRNDCVSNTVAIICAYIGDRVWVYADPLGAILVSIYIMVTWYLAGAEQMPLLTGRSAPAEYINRIIRLCIEADEKVLALETLYVYHYGSKFLVEVHIVLQENTPLKISHDICERVQRKLEHLQYVERAFVHCDYEADSERCPCGMLH